MPNYLDTLTRQAEADEVQAYLLDCLIEECSEVIKAATKIKRFGWDNFNPNGRDLRTNAMVLGQEIDDAIACVQLVQENSSGRISSSQEHRRLHRREVYKQIEALGLKRWEQNG